MNIIYEPDPNVAYWLTLVVTVLLPILVGLTTKVSTPSWVKAVWLLILSAITSVASNLLAVQGAEDIGPMITQTVVTFVIAVATYFGIWKPSAITEKAQKLPPISDAA